jgi:hypothetical protein
MRDWKDRLGIFASAACAVHCAATPILVAALPTLKLTEWMADPRFHQIAAVICCSLVAIAIVPTTLRFRDLRLFSFASSGLGLILAAAFLVPDSCCSSGCCSVEKSGTLAGSEIGSDHSHDGHSHDDHSHHDHAHHHHSSNDQTPSSEPAESSTLLMAGMSIAQPWMTPVGGLLLIVAHGLNMRRRWKTDCGSPNCCANDPAGELLLMPEPSSSEAPLARAS